MPVLGLPVRGPSPLTRRLAATGALAVGLAVGTLQWEAPASHTPSPTEALAPAECGPGSRPETGTVGRTPAEDYASGRAAEGYTCNTRLVSRLGRSGGLKVERYQDAQGNVCAYYDVARMFPLGFLDAGVEGVGTAVVDMTRPRDPVRTATLTTPAMLSPHESLILHRGRGLLMAVMGNAGTLPGMFDVYDVSKDCRKPELLSSSPAGILGHESGLSPDGRTFYASSLLADTITAIDLTNPRLPMPVTTFAGGWSHGVRTSRDGDLLYVADMGYPTETNFVSGGLRIYDVSAINDRRPLAQPTLLSTYTWDDVAVPQVPEPMRIKGRDYLLMVDEFSELAFDPTFSYDPANSAGVARIIDVDDPQNPREVSALRLQVHLEENRAGDQQRRPRRGKPDRRLRVALLRDPALPEPPDRGLCLHRLGPADLRHPRPRATEGDRLPQPAGGDRGLRDGQARLRPRAQAGLVLRLQQRLLRGTTDQRNLARGPVRRAARDPHRA